MTTSATTKTTAPRKPQDRKPSKAEQMQAAEQPPAGHELLKPVETLRSAEMSEIQAQLYEIFDELGVDMENADEDGNVEIDVKASPQSIRALGKLSGILEESSVDADAFAEFDRGRGAQQRVLELAMWYLAQLGESDGSAS